MNLFDVYPLFDIEITHAKGSYLWDRKGTKYLDLYGGHAVISIGHGHPNYVKKVNEQLELIGFYSNSVQNPLQVELAQKLGEISGYPDYQLFLCNSGAEANENALKLASFHTGSKKVIAFKNGFHGRTSAAVSITDNPKIIAPINAQHNTILVDLNDIEGVSKAIDEGDVCALIIEGMQGIGGIVEPSQQFLKDLEQLCKDNKVLLVLDEIQSGYGRTGKFFAHQYANIQPDLITVAKGMGNGFPIGGVLISPDIEAKFGLLGTTFGGNHLACAAGIAVLDTIKEEELIQNTFSIGEQIKEALQSVPEIKEVRGKGLMIGLEFDFPIKPLRNKLLQEKHIFTGVSSDPNVLRILPPLNIKRQEVDQFVNSLKSVLIKSSNNEAVHPG
ncbi:aspartate aminotransferase family protein [Fulvivirgaceae bacterium BMA10]|uniref:Aspartate aminotransferase family protein n=1 Tax=Splendidivirga corallicola TaxID=3051826 RepID=A0ABT8KLK3_9BACT|nr:aspartate aminotransferase family protein [Fulvivirgaceae bacterium BMA10]